MKNIIFHIFNFSNLIHIELTGKENFLLSLIFNETDSSEKETDLIDLQYNNKLKDLIIPEFDKNKGKLTFFQTPFV